MNWNNGYLSDISDIFRTFIGHTTKAQNLSPKETLFNYKYKICCINNELRRTDTDPGAQRLNKAPEHGEAMIVSPSNINKPQINADKRRFVISTHREERKNKVVYHNGLTGSAGCVLSFNPVIEPRVAQWT